MGVITATTGTNVSWNLNVSALFCQCTQAADYSLTFSDGTNVIGSANYLHRGSNRDVYLVKDLKNMQPIVIKLAHQNSHHPCIVEHASVTAHLKTYPGSTRLPKALWCNQSCRLLDTPNVEVNIMTACTSTVDTLLVESFQTCTEFGVMECLFLERLFYDVCDVWFNSQEKEGEIFKDLHIQSLGVNISFESFRHQVEQLVCSGNALPQLAHVPAIDIMIIDVEGLHDGQTRADFHKKLKKNLASLEECLSGSGISPVWSHQVSQAVRQFGKDLHAQVVQGHTLSLSTLFGYAEMELNRLRVQLMGIVVALQAKAIRPVLVQKFKSQGARTLMASGLWRLVVVSVYMIL